MIQLIEDHRDDHGVEPICRVLPIAPATFYDNMAKRADPSRLSDRAKRDAELKLEIERGFEQNLKVYSVRKVWREMHREGFDIARCTVARLMKDIGNEGAIRGKRPRTTIPDKALPCPLDRVNRQFHASAPNVLWVSDFTYVATWQGFVYVAFVIDVFARRIVGWRASRIANAGFGTGHSSKQASTRSTSASLRSRIAISVDQIHRTTGRGEDCTVSRQRRGFL